MTSFVVLHSLRFIQVKNKERNPKTMITETKTGTQESICTASKSRNLIMRCFSLSFLSLGANASLIKARNRQQL